MYAFLLLFIAHHGCSDLHFFNKVFAFESLAEGGTDSPISNILFSSVGTIISFYYQNIVLLVLVGKLQHFSNNLFFSFL